MKIAKYKNVGAMIGSESPLHRWTKLRNIYPESQNESTKSLVKRLTSRCMHCLHLDIWDPCPPLMKQPSKKKPMPCNAPLQRTNAIHSDQLRVGSVCDILGIHALELPPIRAHRQRPGKNDHARVSRILRPISRFRIAQILPQMNLASRASCPGLTIGFLTHPLQWSLCDTNFSSHYNECPLQNNFFASVWRTNYCATT